MTLVDQTPDPRCASKPRNTFPSNSIYPQGLIMLAVRIQPVRNNLTLATKLIAA